MKKKNKEKPIIGFSIGDINGIGPEILIKSLSNDAILNQFTPVIFCNPEIINYYCKILNKEINYILVNSISKIILNKINLIKITDDKICVNPGKIENYAGHYSFLSLQKGTQNLLYNKIDGIVTLPINKKTIQSNKFDFPGHTEYFNNISKSREYLMMMISKKIKIGVYSGHIALKDVSKELKLKRLKRKIQVLIDSLIKDFKIKNPKIAILGLNPHAGEMGMFGNEEEKIIKPVLKLINIKKHKIIYGPFSSDGYFGSQKFMRYDATFALYHDQALIPFKIFSSNKGVNFTSGLEHVRTSPDHGTAYDLAGRNVSNHDSLTNCILLNIEIINNRKIINFGKN